MPVLIQLITHLAGWRLNYNKCIMKYLNFQQRDGSAASFALPTLGSANSRPFSLAPWGPLPCPAAQPRPPAAHGDQTPARHSSSRREPAAVG